MTRHLIPILLFALFAFGAPALADSEPVACTMQYQPVCGTEKGVYKTYGNGCALGAAGAVYQHEGECTTAELAGKQEGTYTPPAHCTVWSDGCNTCSRSGDGQAACTLMACMGEPRPGFCMKYEDTETDGRPTPAPDTSVSSPVNDAPTTLFPTEGSEVSSGVEIPATTSTEVGQSFFKRVWSGIAHWFSGLF